VVTTGLLAANGAGPGDLQFSVEVMNRKASRRTRNPALRFGTFPPAQVRGNQHTPVELRGESPPSVPVPMIPRGRFIPLGVFQVLRPANHPAGQPWSGLLRLDAVRVRFTPARGRFYGPPEAAVVRQGRPAAVSLERAFLDAGAGWFNAPRDIGVVEPADTIDVRLGSPAIAGRSLGVVDDACDGRIDAELRLGAARLRCRATVAVGPPHFAPDRRPFLSVADELNDRQHQPARDAELDAAERAEWVEDLFERIFETVQAMDVDHWRLNLGKELPPAEQRPGIPGDGVPNPTLAMGGRDRLRDPEIAIAAPSALLPQPVAQRARERHRNLSDVNELAAFVRENPARMAELVRRPFGRRPGENAGNQSMRMPPFMRNSNADELTLAPWQFELLMSWIQAVSAGGGLGLAAAAASGRAGGEEGLAPLSPEAAEQRRRVLEQLGDEP
jgi:hypothetical protein